MRIPLFVPVIAIFWLGTACAKPPETHVETDPEKAERLTMETGNDGYALRALDKAYDSAMRHDTAGMHGDESKVAKDTALMRLAIRHGALMTRLRVASDEYDKFMAGR
jgi:hypothetical protein